MDPGIEWVGGQLRSRRFDDLYFSKQGGLGEARAVFLEGCGLPGRWQGRQRFVVAELGFGTGLNILALLKLWAETRPPGATLHIFSVEGFPLGRADAERAHATFPELADLSARMLACWPAGARGLHRMDFPGLGATLDLAVLDVAEALAGWTGRADAWFLDGFAPACNQAMWTADVLQQVAQHSAPGARAATYSVAAAVRHGLEAAGFEIRRRPGFGHKRERLEAALPGHPADPPLPCIAIIGAGVAGAALARSLRSLGVVPNLFAAGPMASANPAALISPRLAAGSHAAAMLHAQAFRRAVDLVRRTAGEAVIATGAVHLLKGPGEAERAEATLSSGLFDPGSLVPLPPPAMSGLLGERVSSPGLDMAEALVVDPAVLRAAWLGAEIGQVSVACVERAADGWHVLDETGALVALADQVVIAAGAGTARLAGLPLRPVRGQVSLSPQALAGAAASWGGYAIPTRRGLLFGATHDRGNNDPSVRSEDNDRNLAALASVRPVLAARLDPGTLTGAAGVRSAAGDHQPVAGAVGPGLFVLGGLAGRGFTLAPLLADHVAALMLGLPSPLLAAQQRLVDPARLRAADEP